MYEPCGRCGKEHDTDKCPDSPSFWKRRGARLTQWRKRAARAGGLGKASLHRLARTFKEMRGVKNV